LSRRICIRGVEVRKRGFCAVQQTASALEGDDSVLESRLVRARSYRVHFLKLFLHAGLDRWNEVRVPDLVERRKVIGQRAFFEQRIVDRIGGRHDGELRSVEQRASDDVVKMSHKIL